MPVQRFTRGRVVGLCLVGLIAAILGISGAKAILSISAVPTTGVQHAEKGATETYTTEISDTKPGTTNYRHSKVDSDPLDPNELVVDEDAIAIDSLVTSGAFSSTQYLYSNESYEATGMDESSKEGVPRGYLAGANFLSEDSLFDAAN